MRKSTATALAASVGIFASCLAVPHHHASAQYVNAYTTTTTDDGITVTAPRALHHRTVGRAPDGFPVEEVSLSRRISFSGLDLRSERDSQVLDQRIEATARRACDQLSHLYPQSQYPVISSDRDCYTQAVDDAMAQKDEIMNR
jgi:UrcA family protein